MPEQFENITPAGDIVRDTESPESEPHKEHLERLHTWIIEAGGKSPFSAAMNQVLTMFGYDVKNINNPEELLTDLQTVAEHEPDTIPQILLVVSAVHDTNTVRDFLARIATSVRNNPKIKQQPLIMATGMWRDAHLISQQTGVDVILPVTTFLAGFIKNASNVPDLLNQLEDNYSDNMFKGKQSFYAEYQDRLKDRSQITADTPQEVSLLQNILEQNDAHDVLDAGCGDGRIALPLADRGFNTVGVDGSPDLIQNASAVGSASTAKFLVGDVRSLPVQEKSHDAIMYNWHVFCDILGNKNKRTVLREAFRVLREGGVLICDIPDRKKLTENKDGVYLDDPGGNNIFIGYVPTEDEMQQLFIESGFAKTEVHSWTTAQGFPKLTLVAHKIANDQT